MEEPVAEKEIYKVKFGNVNKDRGNNLIDPPVELDDYYFWMRDDSRKNTRVIDHLKNENKYTEDKMSDTKELINTLYEEVKSYVKETYDSYPLPHGDGGWNSKYYYFIRTIEGKSFPIHCRINKLSNDYEEILLDENLLAEGQENFDLKSFTLTKDHKIMSYGIDLDGNE